MTVVQVSFYAYATCRRCGRNFSAFTGYTLRANARYHEPPGDRHGCAAQASELSWWVGPIGMAREHPDGTTSPLYR